MIANVNFIFFSPIRRSFLLMMGIMAFSNRVHALDVQLFRPNDSRESSVTSVDSYPNAGDADAGLIFNWVKNPIEFGSSAGDARVDNVVNWIVTTDVLLSYGISDRIGLNIDVPVHWAADVENIFSVVSDKRIGLGDVRANLPILLKKNDENTFRLSIIPFVTAPTGSASDFLGNTNWTGGGYLESGIRFTENQKLFLSLGYRNRERETILNLVIDDEALGNLGYSYRIWPSRGLDFFANVQGSTTIRKFFSEEISSPLEFFAGVKQRWNKDRWMWILGAGRGINNGYGSPDVRVFSGISYVFAKAKKEPVVTPAPAPIPEPVVVPQPEPVPPVVVEEPKPVEKVVEPKPIEKIELTGKVLFESAQSILLAASFPVLDHVIDVLAKHPEISKVEIQAHTDSVGHEDQNMTLSLRRAESVQNYLVQRGISAKRLLATGYGESKPLTTNDTKEGRSQNRRVEFIVLESQQPETVN